MPLKRFTETVKQEAARLHIVHLRPLRHRHRPDANVKNPSGGWPHGAAAVSLHEADAQGTEGRGYDA